MMLLLRLAFKILLSAGLRTWLSVSVLAFAYILIIFYNGLMDGWNQQAKTDVIHWEYGQGQLRHENYDPYNPFAIADAHAAIPNTNVNGVPVLVQPARIFPHNRIQPILLKGIPADQQLLHLPTEHLEGNTPGKINALIGGRMAKNFGLSTGDVVRLRLINASGNEVDTSVVITDLFRTNVPNIDAGNLWIALDDLENLSGHHGHASYVVFNEEPNAYNNPWRWHPLSELTANIDQIIASKKVSSSIIYLLLLALALIAIFDTQVLSIFRRQREIGTYIALGMTKWEVVRLFTFEGSANSLLGAALGASIGTPIFIYLAQHGIKIYDASQNMGITISEVMFPVFGVGLIVTTLVLVFLASVVVSFWPAKKIANMDPTMALKGKAQ